MKSAKTDILINTSQCIKEKDVEYINEYKIKDNGKECDKIPLSLETSFDCPENKNIQNNAEIEYHDDYIDVSNKIEVYHKLKFKNRCVFELGDLNRIYYDNYL